MMTVPDSDSDPGRWVLQRARFLASSEIGLRESVAETVAWCELGYSTSGIARRMGTSESAAKSRLDSAEQEYPGLTYRIAGVDFEAVDDGVDDLPIPNIPRECPVCLKDRVCTPDGAERVYRTSGWGATSMMDDADAVCTFCYSVRLDGVWKRMQSPDHVAAIRAKGGGSKTQSDYREILTRGIDTDRRADQPSVDDAEGW